MSDISLYATTANLVNDPEIGHTPSGKVKATFDIAVNAPKAQPGQTQRPPQYWRCVAWDLAAEAIAHDVNRKVFTRGTKVIVMGNIKADRYTHVEPDGTEVIRNQTELTVVRMGPDMVWMKNNIASIMRNPKNATPFASTSE